MKKLLTFALIAVCLTGCYSAQTGEVGSIDATDIKYFKDDRTNLCFGIIGGMEGGFHLTKESTSLGIACVPCSSVPPKLLK